MSEFECKGKRYEKYTDYIKKCPLCDSKPKLIHYWYPYCGGFSYGRIECSCGLQIHSECAGGRSYDKGTEEEITQDMMHWWNSLKLGRNDSLDIKGPPDANMLPAPIELQSEKHGQTSKV